ncbi:hypothetical protein [Pararhodobacter zhoushanensis]|uniref:Uncharacterized protein n=1 Tax=Pararhodobacter zhoushanensis TaxID=2479545 RepID=A0ABT3GYK0_9RHOB|nr:hypothetical protein [Pararhodobacter zhoushanensis]MCW1932601.1 hypothetical protein [Pararhodobacter zhoushanensis]
MIWPLNRKKPSKADKPTAKSEADAARSAAKDLLAAEIGQLRDALNSMRTAE